MRALEAPARRHCKIVGDASVFPLDWSPPASSTDAFVHRMQTLAVLLEPHGYTLRHENLGTDEGFEKLRSWEVKDFPGCLDPGKSEER